MTFHIYKDKAGEFRWHAKSDNGKIIADSGEGYKNRVDCKHAISIIKNEAKDAEIIDTTLKLAKFVH